MKNIHLLPTDKPSRLSNCHNNKLYLDDVRYLRNYQNIYITSDEKPKNGDWYFYNGNVRKHVAPNNYSTTGFKKIILTTDTDLTKDGVQVINDEFLEWFVKNSSCERVEVEKEYLSNNGKWKKMLLPSEWEIDTEIRYKIIIPQEEPKQTHTLVDELKAYFENTPADKIQSDWDETCKRTEGIDSPTVSEFMEAQKQFMEQEMLEDVAEIKRSGLYNSIYSIVKQIPRKDVEGDAMDAPSCAYEIEQLFYKWQAERMYSEEDMMKAVKFGELYKSESSKSLFEKRGTTPTEVLKKWFEQFKKK